MNLKITLENNSITITLVKNKTIVDSLKLNDVNNFSKILLTNTDLLLKKNHLQKNQITKLLVESTLPDSYTSNRIAKSLEKSFNFALKTK